MSTSIIKMTQFFIGKKIGKKYFSEREVFKNNVSISQPASTKVILGYTKLINFLFIIVMNQQFQVKLLLKQNAEMVSKIQIYRRENQQLIQKNHDLNLSVQNLSEVFAAVGAAWKNITNNEQALFNLMKKRGDSNSKALISKYISHFKTFDEIINRLGEKITNSGHSDEVTSDAKNRLNAFVQNYEMFFREIVDSYFKFNDEYLQWVTQLKNKAELSQNFRLIANKQIENKMKIKEFETFMNEFRGRFKIYECQNQHKLLDGILFSKNQQINSLIQLNHQQTRRLQLVTNYSTLNAQAILDAGENDFECFCGGRQLQYFKKEWEKHLDELRKISDKSTQLKSGDTETRHEINREDLELIEFEKQKLFERISYLQSKIEKMKTQSRLSEDLVLNSSAYSILHSQTEELVVFIDELLQKINQNYTYLFQIEKARQEQILQLKNKLQKVENSPNINKTSFQSPKIRVQTNLIEFKSNVTQLIKDLTREYTVMNSQISQKEESINKSKECIAFLQKEIAEMNKKIEQLEASQNLPLEFRHEKFNQIDKRITQLLDGLSETEFSDKQHLVMLWKEFVGYVKSRDKKVKDLQTVIKKKEKDLAQKDKLVSALQQNLKETEAVYLSAKTQVNKFNDFIEKTQKEIHSLAEKNLSLRSEFQQEKALLNYKIKAQNESKAKMQEKMKYHDVIEEQINEMRKIVLEAELNYENWIVDQEKKLMNTSLELEEAKKNYYLKRAESEQKDKAIKRINQEKEKWKSECNKLGAKFNAIEEKSQIGVLKMEMEEYKRKLMCNCSRDQERSVVLKTCPHAFCKKCIEDMNNSRNRKCPLCGIKFGKSDLHDIILS